MSMRYRILAGSALAVLLLVFRVEAIAQQGGGHRGHHAGHWNGGGWFGIGGGWAFYGPPYYTISGPDGFFTIVPPFFMVGAGGMAPWRGPMGQGPVAPPPPAGLFERALAPNPGEKAVRKDPARATQLVTMGDRLFRNGNIKKAEERYRQAARLDVSAAAPRVRLAQVALVREQYTEAAHRLREAETAEPGWITTAPDIQAIFGEPGDFAKHVSRIESHLQVHPDDRDAWLVLGAQWYLSGRAARAADVFQRLNDPKRKPDIALAAFLDATNPPK